MSVKLERKNRIKRVLAGSFELYTLQMDIDVAVDLVLQLTMVERSDVSRHFDELGLNKADFVLFHKLKFDN